MGRCILVRLARLLKKELWVEGQTIGSVQDFGVQYQSIHGNLLSQPSYRNARQNSKPITYSSYIQSCIEVLIRRMDTMFVQAENQVIFRRRGGSLFRRRRSRDIKTKNGVPCTARSILRKRSKRCEKRSSVPKIRCMERSGPRHIRMGYSISLDTPTLANSKGKDMRNVCGSWVRRLQKGLFVCRIRFNFRLLVRLRNTTV